MSGFEYIDLDSNRVRVTYGVHGRVVRIIPAAHKGLRNRQAYLPTDPAQRLAMAEAIVGGPLIEVGDLPEVEKLERTGARWHATIDGRTGGAWLALARAIKAREKADAEAQAAKDAKVERVKQIILDHGPDGDSLARAVLAAMDADQ